MNSQAFNGRPTPSTNFVAKSAIRQMSKSSIWLFVLLILCCFEPAQTYGQRFFGGPRYYVPNRPQYNPYHNSYQNRFQPAPQYVQPRRAGPIARPTRPVPGSAVNTPPGLPPNFQPTQKRTFPASQMGFDDLPPGSFVTVIPLTAEQKREMAVRDRLRRERAAKRQEEVRNAADNPSIYPRLVGEFERQQVILLSVSDWQSHHFGVLKQIVEKTRGHAKLLVMFNKKNMHDDSNQIVEVLEALAEDGTDYPHLYFMNHELDTIWLRDFGPQFAENKDGSAVAVDFYYDGMRQKDDDLPEDWSDFSGTEFNHVPWTLQGGNLISNGKGLSVTTTQIYQDNNVNFTPTSQSRSNDSNEESREFIKKQLKKFCNIKELVVLQPLENESTRHVDMFGTFLAPDLFLMAKLDPRSDPRNARILDENARALAKLKVDGKPLRVERIQVPPRRGKHWSPYTNVILTDKVVLIPVLDSDPRGFQAHALQVYRRLLPDHQVDTINMTSMAKLQGSLHCLSCNVPSFAKLPTGILGFAEALNGKEFERRVAQPRPGPNPRDPDKTKKELAVSEPVSESPVSAAPEIQGEIEVVGGDESLEEKLARARIAVQTYRRVFNTKSGGRSYDCFAIGVDEKKVLLITVKDKRRLTITLSFLESSDRKWVVDNQDQINRFGPRVSDFVKNYDLDE